MAVIFIPCSLFSPPIGLEATEANPQAVPRNDVVLEVDALIRQVLRRDLGVDDDALAGRYRA